MKSLKERPIFTASGSGIYNETDPFSSSGGLDCQVGESFLARSTIKSVVPDAILYSAKQSHIVFSLAAISMGIVQLFVDKKNLF